MQTETLAAGPKESATRRTIKNLRWWILGWALAAGIINYMDRSAISIAAPQLIKEFGMTRTDIGLLGTVFSWTYAFCPVARRLARGQARRPPHVLPRHRRLEHRHRADGRRRQDVALHHLPLPARRHRSAERTGLGKAHCRLVPPHRARTGHRHLGQRFQVGTRNCPARPDRHHAGVRLAGHLHLPRRRGPGAGTRLLHLLPRSGRAQAHQHAGTGLHRKPARHAGPDVPRRSPGSASSSTARSGA